MALSIKKSYELLCDVTLWGEKYHFHCQLGYSKDLKDLNCMVSVRCYSAEMMLFVSMSLTNANGLISLNVLMAKLLLNLY